MKSFVKSWVSSIQKRRQRKYRFNAPLHIRRRMLSVHLTKELRTKYKRRAFPVRKGDKVKILRGRFRGLLDEVTQVDYKNLKIYVKGAERTKKDKTTKAPVAIEPSNTQIISLNLNDSKRIKAIEQHVEGQGAKKIQEPTRHAVEKNISKQIEKKVEVKA